MVGANISPDELRTRLRAHGEWLLIRSSGRAFPLQSAEFELTAAPGKMLFGFLDEAGFQTWRITACQLETAEIRLDLSRGLGREIEKIRLVPRAAAGQLSAELELARLARANRIAEFIKAAFPVKLIRVGLTKENGRLAQIVLAERTGTQALVFADVTESLTPELLLSTALLRLDRAERRRKKTIERVWIIGPPPQARKVQKLHALLREEWKRKILVKEFAGEAAGPKAPESGSGIRDLPGSAVGELWRGKPPAIKPPESPDVSATAQKIVALAPGEIDLVRSRNGETLRFRGLAFARVRRVSETERAWFGIGPSRRLLTAENWSDLLELLDTLAHYRRFDSPARRHEYYRLAPEAWLEAILRKNIKLLDSNLILSPVYHQFRAGRDRIDLLALRRDGRLVVIELKTAPDREMVFQAADYWRKIELQRRRGNLRKARLFGEMEIADRPALIYLAAPTLSFHREFARLARMLAPEIEMHRFNLAENWRQTLRVLERVPV